MTRPEAHLAPSRSAEPMRPRLLAALLAAVAVWLSAQPIDSLFIAQPWLGPALVQLGLVAGIGVLARLARASSTAVALAQLAVLVIGQSVLFPSRDPLWGGLVPTWSTATTWRALVGEAVTTITGNGAPAPAPAGVAFVLTLLIALVAWAVDVVAVSSRMPAVAGLPLVTPLLTAIANSSEPLPVSAVVPPLACWMLMLLEAERGWLASWRPDLAAAHRLPARGRRLVGAFAVAAVALVVGMVGGALVPHLPQRYLAEGLGTGELSRGSRVGFSPNSDMLVDLRSGDTGVVLRYETTDPTPQPLRISVSTTYTAGRWAADPVRPAPSRTPQLPNVPGLTAAVANTRQVLKVSRSGLAAPYLASPTPLVEGLVVGALWSVDPVTGAVAVNRTPSSYSMTYLSLAPTRAQLEQSPPPRGRIGGAMEVPSYVDTPLFQEATLRAIGNAATSYDQAVAIQSYLRSGDFTYSLTLDPPPPGLSEEAAGRSAVDRFLTTRKGYCVQFATTMVLMARSLGIPARMATGFLAGRVSTDDPTQREVIAADAHAWPELYFEGIGWLRFEPTPATRSTNAPGYSTDTGGATPAPAPSATTSAGPTTAAPEPTSNRERPETPEGGEATVAEAPSRWPWVLGAALLVLLVLGAVPLAGRLSLVRRRQAVRGDPQAQLEVEWAELAERLRDLDLDVPDAATPKDLHARLVRSAVLDPASDAALGRVLSAIEAARYAPASTPCPDLGAIRKDAALVRGGAAALLTRPQRIRALLWPRSGRRALRLPVGESVEPTRGRWR